MLFVWVMLYLSDGEAPYGIRFEAEMATGKGRPRWTMGNEIHLDAPATIRFLISAQVTRSGAIVSLISDGQTIRSFPAEMGQPQVIEIECQHDSYFRLEVRDGKKGMLALTNPIYLKVRQR